jgi:hypothetical protein
MIPNDEFNDWGDYLIVLLLLLMKTFFFAFCIYWDNNKI